MTMARFALRYTGFRDWPRAVAPARFVAALERQLRDAGAGGVERADAGLRFSSLPMPQVLPSLSLHDGACSAAAQGNALRVHFSASIPVRSALAPFALVIGAMAAFAVYSGAPALSVLGIALAALGLFGLAIRFACGAMLHRLAARAQRALAGRT